MGLLLLGAGLWALIEDVPRWNAVWYLPAWYGYLLIVDAALYLRRGRSFVSHDRQKFLSMLLWSVPFWIFFEASNLVLRNWYYVFGLRNPLAAALLTAVAFATVLPACFFHAEILEAYGVSRKLSCRPRGIPAAAPAAVAAFGGLCAVLPMLLPRIAFPLIWFAPLGLDGGNYRAGRPSLLRDFEEGNCARLARFLLGGLWAGVVWELFNSWARCKWIYAVPGFEDHKLFEMPLAGFLGFPVLAVGAFCFFSFVGETGSRSVWRHRVAAAAALAFCVAVYPLLQQQTVRSLRPLLEELPSLDVPAQAGLSATGIETPERLVRAARREGIEGLSTRTGVSIESLRSAREESVLALHKGMGVPRALLLEAAGIRYLGQLALQDPDSLWSRLRQLAGSPGRDLPRLAEVSVWIKAAKGSPDDLPRR